MLSVFYCKIPENIEEKTYQKYLNLLSPNDRNINKSFINLKDKIAHLMGKFLLFKSLQQFGYSYDILGNIKYNEYSRPYINFDIDFNISHSGCYAICVVGKSIHVGIDIEKVRKIDLSDFQETMSEQEWIIINSATNPVKKFLKYWTIKESVIKAIGNGLLIPLTNIHINKNIVDFENTTWFIYELNIDKNYSAHLACNIQHTEIDIKKIIPEL